MIERYDKRNCVDRYDDFSEVANIEVFYDVDDERWTFEVCVYRDNAEKCEELFGQARKTLTVEEYMLGNKSEVAYQLASKVGTELTPPKYVSNAITWLNS